MAFGNNGKRAFAAPWNALSGLLYCALASLLFPAASPAHSLGAGVEIAGQTVIVRSRYADGAFPDADAWVYSPDEPERVFQSGRTDRNGVFSFVPNAAGAWRVVVDDGMGHRKEIEVTVDDGAPIASEPFSPPQLRLAAAALGLAAIGFYLGRVSQKQTGRGRPPVEGA